MPNVKKQIIQLFSINMKRFLMHELRISIILILAFVRELLRTDVLDTQSLDTYTYFKCKI